MHIPVLFQESIDALAIRPDGVYVDGTLGGAGHALAIAQHLGPHGTLIGFDVDSHALARAREKLNGVACQVILVQDNFRNLAQVLATHDIKEIHGILLDLGWSSFQIADADRGFSFQQNGSLKMTLKDTLNDDDLTAWDIVNTWEEEHIADILYGYGDEHASRRISHAIIQARRKASIETTFDLVEVIHSVLPQKGWMHTNTATKTFQALRITVNDEYGALHEVLEQGIRVLAPQGRFAIITFHSGEDRIVKQAFRAAADTHTISLVTKKPISPSHEETQHNPRARSAKLRTVEKQELSL
jgi:16S rRNA (cytosine1402-N4)-methyltransferase